MEILKNPYRGKGLPESRDLARGTVVSDPADASSLYSQCPVAASTPLISVDGLATDLDVGSVHLKDERNRMGLGSFKALGAAHVIAADAAARLGTPTSASDDDIATALDDRVYVCASAGNHGLSVAAGARVFGARSIVYLSETVPEAFKGRLEDKGAEVVRWGSTYEESMEAAATDADANGWTLLSDSSWPGYVEIPSRVMEGYLIMADEIGRQINAPPTHVFLQAGVGGLAAAMAAAMRAMWGDDPVICVVEPSAAPALIESIRAGSPVIAPGPSSIMGRLDCKEPSHLALAALARDADWFVTITDDDALETVGLLDGYGIETTPSGAAGLAGLDHLGPLREELGVSTASRVLAFITEGPEQG